MADQAINELPTKSSPSTGDKVLMIGTAEEYQMLVDDLATAVLNKLTSKTYNLDQGSKTLIAALNELNSKTLSHSYSLSGIGWKRVLKFEGVSASSAGGSLGYGGIIIIRTAYSNDANMYDLISFASRYYTAPESNFMKLHGIGNEVITKIRHTIDSNANTAYIEVYYNSNLENPVNISIPSNDNANNKINKWMPTNGESTAETVGGVTVVSTLDLTSA